jgi:hypothetical protein
MAIYGARARSEKRQVQAVCERCGEHPGEQVHRHVSDGVCFNVAPRARLRVKIAPHYAQMAGMPETANLRVCPPCADLIFDRVNNRHRAAAQ